MPAVSKKQVKTPPPEPAADPTPAEVPFKDAVKAALAKKKPTAGWPQEPSTKHRKGKA